MADSRFNSFSGKRFQFSQDLFQGWKHEQNAEIAMRGASKDPAVEEEHNNYMLRQNMNAYLCYRELDRYTGCLKEKNLITSGEGGTGYEINTRNRVNEKQCRSTHTPYVACMGAQQNQEALLGNAAIHQNCTRQREDLFHCMEENKEKETKLHEAQCEMQYRRMLRCGLNHLWNDYWRAITKVGDAEEYHLYELSRDDNKRQEYLRMVTTNEEELRRQRADKKGREQGYYLDQTKRDQ